MSKGELKGVMIGAGYFAGFQAEAWSRIAGVQMVAVCDTVPGRAEEFAARWNIPRAYQDAETMLKVERPHFVDITTRPDSHRELTLLAAWSGAHVICQKPMAPTWEDCLAMVKACAQSNIRLIIHENWRWQPWFREIKRLLDQGAFGRPFHLGFRMRTGDGRGPQPYKTQSYFQQMERFLVYEVAVHFLDTFRYLAGEIATVFCQIDRINPVIKGEDYALIQVGFASGAHGLVNANRISGPSPTDIALGMFSLEGERAMIRLTPDGRLWFTEHGKTEALHDYQHGVSGYKGDSVKSAQEHFVSCLRSGAPSESDGESYLKTVAAVFACYRSVETGLNISLSTSAPG